MQKQYENDAEFLGSIIYHAIDFQCFEFGQAYALD